jgi:hypothetical protein
MMRRRFLPLILGAGISTLFVCFVLFQDVAWSTLPQAVGFGESSGPSEEDIATGKNILPDLRTTTPKPEKPFADEDLSKPGAHLESPYPIGETKAPGSNYTRTLVLASTQEEDTTWVEAELADMLQPHGQLSHAIYVVNNKSAPLHTPKNKGHEVMVYLTYIIDSYDDLPDISIFMHAHRFAWHNNQLLGTDAAEMVRRLSPEHVTRLGYMNLRCHWDPGCPDWLHPGAIEPNNAKKEEHLLATAWTQLFPLEPIPTVLAQPCCAQFAVSRERIRAIPKQRYVYLRDWVHRTELDDYLSGRVFEYVWQYIFSSAPIHCPSMNACYCDGYGVCFGGYEAFNDVFKMRYEMNEFKDELREWRRKSDRIEQLKKHTDEGKKLPEDAEVDFPEHGRDVWLEAKIAEIHAELKKRIAGAMERGKDPANRAIEAGRPWKEGDGF